METDDFEWDDDKAAANLRKHGIDFFDACGAFEDAFYVEDIDDRMDYGEERIQLIGRVGDELIVVIYVERGKRIRIISARPATREEYDDYYSANSQDRSETGPGQS